MGIVTSQYFRVSCPEMNAFCPFSVPQIELHVDLSPEGDWEESWRIKENRNFCQRHFEIKSFGENAPKY